MEIEEVKERYKILPLWARLLAALLVGTLPAAYVYFDEGDAMLASLEDAKQAAAAARTKFEHASQKKQKLPQLERELATAEEQLHQARRRLPDSYNVEDVLQKTATIAKEVGVRMQRFEPTKEIPGQGNYRYMELPVKSQVNGKFSQVAAFYDRMAHLETSVFVRRLHLASVVPDLEKSGDAKLKATQLQKTPYEIAKEQRQSLYIESHFDLLIDRGMTEAEIAQSDALSKPVEKKAADVLEKIEPKPVNLEQDGQTDAASREKGQDKEKNEAAEGHL